MKSNNQFITFILFFIPVVLICSIDLKGQSTHKSGNYLDSIIEDIMLNHHIPGVAAIAVKDDAVIWSGNYGFANISQNIEVSDSTCFMLGSTSKTITGTAFMQLFENGLIGLDDDVNNYLPFQVNNPQFPAIAITPRMLLSHVSGIRDNWNILNTVHHQGSDSPISLAVFTEGYLTTDGNYYNALNYGNSAPGTAYEYTNAGTTLIAYLIEVITNTTFEEYCQNHIFAPLEMAHTSWFLSELNLSNVAIPYTVNNGNFNAFGHYGSPVYPCGFLKTSTNQLARFLLAIMNNGQYNGVEILESSTLELMTTLHYPEISQNYGLQFQLIEGFIGHDGGGPGVNCRMFYYPETKSGAIVLLNTQNYTALGLISDEVFQYAEGFTTSTQWENNDNLGSSAIILDQNIPNPFNTQTYFTFNNRVAGPITLEILTLNGRKVVTLIENEFMVAGKHNISFKPSDFQMKNGIYFYSVTSNKKRITKKMIYSK